MDTGREHKLEMSEKNDLLLFDLFFWSAMFLSENLKSLLAKVATCSSMNK